jgi:alkylation response protein AidB-like acyl-CoA dehydrogenase
LAAEILGSTQEYFERRLAYLKGRQRFEVAIESFQSLQYRAAIMFVAIELSKSLAIEVLMAIDENTNNLKEIASLAKAKSGKALKLLFNQGIQMHGGVGMTHEVEI